MEITEELRNTMMSYASKAGRFDALCDTIKELSGSTIANELSGNEMIDFLVGIIERGEQ